MNCPNCRKEIPLEDALYCPYCSLPLKLMPKRTSFPTAAGILTIISSCMCVVLGIPNIIVLAVTSGYGFFLPLSLVALVVNGFLGVFAFAFGLAGGILTLKRRRYGLALTGQVLVLACGLSAMVFYPYSSGLLFGVPTVVLSILSTVFTTVSKREFT